MSWNLLFALLCGALALTSVQPARAAEPAARTVILAGKLFDARAGRVLTNQAIVIDKDRIISVGAQPDARPGDQMIDLSAYTVLPGLIDAHTHLTSDTQFGYEELGISTQREALTGAKKQASHCWPASPGPNVGAIGYSDIALRDAIDAGDVPGPHMMVSGPPLGITGGHCDNNLLPSEYHAVADGVADGIAAVQRRGARRNQVRRSVIKFCATGGVLSQGR